jgi:hypothetical protein
MNGSTQHEIAMIGARDTDATILSYGRRLGIACPHLRNTCARGVKAK